MELELGETIRILRTSKNFTQDDMAEKLKLSQNGYRKIEKGETDPSYSRLEQIAKVLGMSVMEILLYKAGNKDNSHDVGFWKSTAELYKGLLDEAREYAKSWRETSEKYKKEIEDLKAEIKKNQKQEKVKKNK